MHENRIFQTFVFLSSVLFIALGTTRPAEASGAFDGNWIFKYSCNGTTGVFADRCRRGEGDSFTLINLTESGNRVCGYHVATGYVQNKVDEGDLDGGGPSIYGAVSGDTATVRFRSAWNGAVGIATMTRRKGSIVWHVVKPLTEQSVFPDDAVLSKYISRLPYRPTPCDAALNKTVE
ncbi:hypothetical protein PQR14_07390 [Paraburkholderia bryophila]|uniref:hypothetical protein n=1 Tax=Burkholderiaceae TaxID=119060 RepID=UPI001E42546E|nr:hypothetical protein [Burkholderia sp. 9120]